MLPRTRPLMICCSRVSIKSPFLRAGFVARLHLAKNPPRNAWAGLPRDFRTASPAPRARQAGVFPRYARVPVLFQASSAILIALRVVQFPQFAQTFRDAQLQAAVHRAVEPGRLHPFRKVRLARREAAGLVVRVAIVLAVA